MDKAEITLIDIIRRSERNHGVLDKYFNPERKCFACLLISNFKLKDACKMRNINLEEVVKQLD